MGGVAFTPEDLIDHDAVAAVFRDSSGSVLALRHLKWGFWSLPVGKAHPGQTPFDGLVEEMKEELGVTVTSAKRIASAVVQYQEDRDVRLRFHVFEVDSYEGTVRNLEPAKHAELAYLAPSELSLKEALSDATLLFLESQGLEAVASWSGSIV